MNEEILDIETNPVNHNKRPAFLMVLCILTFVGSGLGIFGAIINLLTTDLFTGQSASAFSQLGNTPFGDVNLEEMMKYSKYSQILNLVACLFCLAGAIIMFKLKKAGFYLYVVGALVAILGAFVGTRGLNSGFFASMGALVIVISILINGAFVVMYGLNLKHMK